MKPHIADKPDAAKVQRMLRAWSHGVEIEDMEDRFGIGRSEIYKILKKNGVVMLHNGGVTYGRETVNPGTKPRTDKWG